jgi:UDP-galactopyranose mutase
MTRDPLLTWSHLRWDFLYQRPQQVMTRFARKRPVLFIEAPVTDRTSGFVTREAAPGVMVLQPRLPAEGPGFGPDQTALLEPMVRAQIEALGWTEHAAWLSTPMAVDLALRLSPIGIVYDCMDESALPGAPPGLIECERRLLEQADAVMTGGPSLHEAKKDRHPLVRCFPSSVDQAHFANPDAEIPEDQIRIPHPRIGYSGVIDERIDLALVEALAEAMPDVSFVMIGPLEKIDPANLPRCSNLHYLGPRRYQELPGYMHGWDVAMMPFVIGPATRFLSPAQALESMAASRPIVSTPIADVAGPYRDIVYLGDGPEDFVTACRQALNAPPTERAERSRLANQVLERTSWDQTAERMEAVLDMVAGTRRARDRRTVGSAGMSGGAGRTGLDAA